MAGATPTPAVGPPRIVEVAGGSMIAPQGAVAAPATATATAAPTTPTPSAAAAAPSAPAAQASAGAGLLQRALALIPLTAGVVQALVGFLITRGTISIAAAPFIGGWPKLLVGALVAATATPSILGGISKLLGRQGPPGAGPAAAA